MPQVAIPEPPTPLPRGRHHLSREEVRASQRARILVGMVEAVAAKGYAGTTVADALTRARASRETFYQLFRDKEDCFVAAYDLVVDSLLAELADVARPGGRPGGPRSLGAVVGAFLAGLAARPAFARTFLLEVYGAGPRALDRRVAVHHRFIDEVAQLVYDTPAADLPPHRRVAVEGFVGATSAMVTMQVAAGGTADLGELGGPLATLAEQLGLRP